ncbi:hypothetical protein [Motiliproteus sediminis]|uniref:hypothetical protein n=1 Tax=Motiliproteus sediminis TaxID=1468178 RepID=UPI001AEF83BF|nr:hypothetical protein [Motiliproteus sediminis]
MDTTPQFNSLKLVGKISLWFSLVAFIGLTAVVILAGVPEADYLETLRSLSNTRDRLPLVMLAGGLVLAVGTGVTTWLITLYSTFRVAGPLYRFSRNLESGIRSGKVPQIRIRGNDQLQQECDLLQQSVGQLYAHYRHIDALTVAALNAGKAGDREQTRALLKELGEQQGRVRYETAKTR